MAEDLPTFDRAAVMARLRAGDAEEITRAYSRTFGTDEGRFVLAHILAEAGVGQKFGGELKANGLAYHQGGHDVALEIMERAGFDGHSAVLAIMTDHLEGQEHEREFGPSATAADPELGD